MLDFYTISAVINFIASTLLGTIVLSKKEFSYTNVTFVLFTYSVAVWSLFYFFWQIADNSTNALLWTQLFIASASLIPIFFFNFVVLFTRQTTKINRTITIIGYVSSLCFISVSFTTLLVRDVSTKLSFAHWPEPGVLFPLYLCIWLLYVIYSLIVLFNAHKVARGALKLQIYLLIMGMTIGFVGGITNYFLWYNIQIPPIGNILVSFYVLFVGYAIIKHKLFNLKVILAEVAVTMLWLTTIVRSLLSDNVTDLVINSVFVAFVTLFGIFVVYNVRSEVSQREEIEKLMSGLSRVNKRLQAMDKQKSEFVSIASHQLRSPLTAIRGYSSMLLEGSFGKFPAKAQQPLEAIAESARMMANSIEDYLSVSRIESGNMKFDLANYNLVEQAERVVDGLRQQATKQGLLLLFKQDVSGRGYVHADKGKVEQILHNLINNALKYTQKGSITVYVHDNKKQDKIFVEVIDTGIGMSSDTLENLFQKFLRAKKASSINVHGTGLGLYVAKKMAHEMHGDVYADSEGEGKGSNFVLELPQV